VPVFPSRHAREKRFWRPISPKLSGRHFFGVTMFAPSRFFSASDILGGCPGSTWGRGFVSGLLVNSRGWGLTSFQLPKVLISIEDAHLKSMSTD